MRIEVTGRHLTVTPAMRQVAQERLARFERVLGASAVSAQIVMTQDKARLRVEINLHARGEHFLHGEATARDWQTALAGAAGKIEHQAQTLAGKWKGRKRRALPAARSDEGSPRPRAEGAGAGVRIVRARRLAMKSMSIDEAALAMSDGRRPFLGFRNAANDAVTVLFRRPDGNLGLIEPEA